MRMKWGHAHNFDTNISLKLDAITYQILGSGQVWQLVSLKPSYLPAVSVNIEMPNFPWFLMILQLRKHHRDLNTLTWQVMCRMILLPKHTYQALKHGLVDVYQGLEASLPTPPWCHRSNAMFWSECILSENNKLPQRGFEYCLACP